MPTTEKKVNPVLSKAQTEYGPVHGQRLFTSLNKGRKKMSDRSSGRTRSR